MIVFNLHRGRTALVALVALAVAVVSGLQAFSVADERADAQRIEREIRFVVAWGGLVEGVEEEYAVQSAALLGFTDDADAARATAEREAAEVESLEAFDELSGEVGELADFIATGYREAAAESDRAGDDFYLRTTEVLWSIDRWGLASDADAVLDLYVANQLPRLVAADRLLAVALERFDELPPETRSWFAGAPAASAAGFDEWIVDAGAPFARFVDLDQRVATTLPGAYEAVIEVVTSDDFDRLAASDAWIGRWSDHRGADPPNDVAALLLAANAVETKISAAASETGALVAASARDDADDLSRELVAYFVLAALALGALLAFAAWRYRRLERRAHLWRRDAGIDSLTGVANARALEHRAGEMLAESRPGRDALIMIDIDRFKTVNDTYGHLAGDGLLRIVGERLHAELDDWASRAERDRDDALLARLGGDEFVVMLHDVGPDHEGAIELAERMRASASRPTTVAGVDIQIAASAAVAYSNGESTLLDLRTEADLGLYQAKQAGGDQVRVFDDPVVHDILRTIHRGEADDSICAHLQPIFDLGELDAPEYEALARWTDTDGEVITAERWLQPLQQAGASGQLLRAMVTNVANILRSRPDITGRVWLNVGPADIGSDGAAHRMLAMMDEVGLDPARAGIEIIETAPISDIEATARNLRMLKEAGMLLAVDDFGSGFTPIGHLVALPFDVVKLDRSVIAGVDGNVEQATLVAATVDICENLSMGLVAEGVERVAELDTLIQLGVRTVQGYLLHRPAAPDAFPAHVTLPTQIDLGTPTNLRT